MKSFLKLISAIILGTVVAFAAVQVFTEADLPSKLSIEHSPTAIQKTGLIKAVNLYNAALPTNGVVLTPEQYWKARSVDLLNSWASSVMTEKVSDITTKYLQASDAKKALIEAEANK